MQAVLFRGSGSISEEKCYDEYEAKRITIRFAGSGKNYLYLNAENSPTLKQIEIDVIYDTYK